MLAICIPGNGCSERCSHLLKVTQHLGKLASSISSQRAFPLKFFSLHLFMYRQRLRGQGPTTNFWILFPGQQNG